MRKLGIEIFYWLENWQDDQVRCFAKARAAGFDAVEISLINGPEIDITAFRAGLEHHQLAVFCSVGLPLANDITSADASIRRSGIEYLKRCAETAAKIGSPILGGLPHVPWLHFPSGADLRPYRERSAAAIHEVAAAANDVGVLVCTELINRYETYIFNTVAEGLDYLRLVDHSAVKLQLDTYHMNMEEDDLPAAIRQAGDNIGHFHCADSNRKLPGRGHVDWEAIKSALDDVGYPGTLVIETFPNPAAETGRTVNTWRPLVHNFDDEAIQALAFLREHVA
jgi:D-psicose/D-tagatose/L-ribulose 3-epimerase